MAEPTVAVEVPVTAGGDLLPARQVDLWRAVRLGLVGGLTAAFVSANGMVEAFSERALLGGVTLGSLLLVAVPLLVGYLAGRPPPVLQGFATPQPGWRNVAGGLLAGLLSGVVMAVFVTLIATFDVRQVLINVTPELVRVAPRLLTFGLDLGAGLVLILVLTGVLGAVAGTLHLLRERWRRAVLVVAVWVLAVAMLQPFVVQVLRGIQAELRIWTAPLGDFLYEPSGALSVPGAVAVAAVAFGIHALLTREGRRPARTRLEALPDRSRRLLRLAVLAGLLFILGLLPQVLGPFLSEVLNIAGIFLLMALGLNIVVGFAGLLDLGYVAFFAVGAYVTALLTSPQSSLGVGWIFWAAVPFVVLAAAVSGLVVGTPVLRDRPAAVPLRLAQAHLRRRARDHPGPRHHHRADPDRRAAGVLLRDLLLRAAGHLRHLRAPGHTDRAGIDGDTRGLSGGRGHGGQQRDRHAVGVHRRRHARWVRWRAVRHQDRVGVSPQLQRDRVDHRPGGDHRRRHGQRARRRLGLLRAGGSAGAAARVRGVPVPHLRGPADLHDAAAARGVHPEQAAGPGVARGGAHAGRLATAPGHGAAGSGCGRRRPDRDELSGVSWHCWRSGVSPGTSAGSGPSMGSTSTSTRERSSASSAQTAPVRRPCSTSSPG